LLVRPHKVSYTAVVRCRLCARRRRAAAGVSHGPRSQYRRDREPSQLLQGWRRPPLPQPPSYLGRLTTPCKFSQLHNFSDFSGLCFLLSFLANITFRTLHFSQPACLCSSLHACLSTRSLRLSNTDLLSAPFVHTSFGARSFSIAAPTIWNSLHPSLRTCTSPHTFRRHLKTHYCQQAFQST